MKVRTGSRDEIGSFIKTASSGERTTDVGAAADVSSGDVSRAARLPAPAHRRINGAVFSLPLFLSLFLPSSAPGSVMRVALDAARQGEEEAASCRDALPPSVRRFSTRSRFSLASNKRPSIDGPRCTRRGRAAARVRRGLFLSSSRNLSSPPLTENNGIRANKILLEQGVLYCFTSSFSFFFSLSPLLLRANVTKSAAANALRSGLPLENREEELLPRGESIPRCLWWSKGDCRNERRRDATKREGGWRWDIAGSNSRNVGEGKGEWMSYASEAKRAKGLICTRRGCWEGIRLHDCQLVTTNS